MFSFTNCPSGHGFSGERLAKPRQLFVLMLFGFEAKNTLRLFKDKVPLLMEDIHSIETCQAVVAGGLVGDRPAGAARPCGEDLPGGGHRQP